MKRDKIRIRDLRALYARQGGKCAYTGADLTPETASLDHMTPLCRDGDHTISNLAIVLTSVNIAKGTMTYPEFLALCRDVARHSQAGAAPGGVHFNGECDRGLFND